MTPRAKLVVAGILALGGIASTATIIRIPYIHYAADTKDFLYASTDIAVWSIAETAIGITASSLATLRPLFRRFLTGSRRSGTSLSKPTGGPGRAGYIRSASQNNDLEEFDLRSNIGGNSGITTVIKGEWSTANGDIDVEQGLSKGGTKRGEKDLRNKNAMQSTNESRLAVDSGSEEVDQTTAGWGSRGSERGHELRIEVTRTVFQSAVVSLPEESPTTPELPSSPYTSASRSPRVAAMWYADHRDPT